MKKLVALITIVAIVLLASFQISLAEENGKAIADENLTAEQLKFFENISSRIVGQLEIPYQDDTRETGEGVGIRPRMIVETIGYFDQSSASIKTIFSYIVGLIDDNPKVLVSVAKVLKKTGVINRLHDIICYESFFVDLYNYYTIAMICQADQNVAWMEADLPAIDLKATKYKPYLKLRALYARRGWEDCAIQSVALRTYREYRNSSSDPIQFDKAVVQTAEILEELLKEAKEIPPEIK